MDVMSAIKGRKSIRKYKKKDIPESLLKEILEAARIAPSAANRQPWEMIVIDDQKLKADLVPVCKNQQFVGDCSVFLVAIENTEQKWAKMDIAIALDELSLAAHEKGLGTCWIGAFDKDKLAEMLEVPNGKAIAVCMTLGYPDEKPEGRARKSFDELFHWNKY